MRYRVLGATGLNVSEIGFGAWGIGGRTAGHTSYGDTDDATSLAALQRAVEQGITFFDTSSVYGNGHSETLLGRAFGSRRRDVIIATKAGYESWDRAADFSTLAVATSLERSLQRLRTDYIDLFQLHNPPLDALRCDDLLRTLERFMADGKVRAWGVSAKSPAAALEAIEACAPPIVQANFNMMDVRALTSGLFDVAERRGTGFIARTPLCFGFLAGKIGRDTVFPEGDHRLGWSREQLDTWIDGARDVLAAVSAEPRRESVASALRFCLSFPVVSSVIPGILTAEEVDQNVAASAAGPLPMAEVDRVLAINRERQFFVSKVR